MLTTMLHGNPVISDLNQISQTQNTENVASLTAEIKMPYSVPLYSQISDISWTDWKQKGCGVTDVAMIVNYYKPDTTNAQEALEFGIKTGAYVKNVGWSHDGLARLATKYNMTGEVQAFWDYDKDTAFEEFKKVIKDGPAIASIHRNFDPKLSFGHLVVITGFDDKLVYYNDPGKREGIRSIPIEQFMKGWKRKLIVIRPKIETELEKNLADSSLDSNLKSDTNNKLALAI
jgi:uncharacterized protein YvpB